MKQQSYRIFALILICTFLLLSMTLYSPRTHATTTLGTMSTASLIDHILSRDYGKTILLFSDLDAAYSSLLISDDTFAELERRPDAASELQNRLNEITKNGYSEDDYETVTQIGLLRTLLSLPIYQQNLANVCQA